MNKTKTAVLCGGFFVGGIVTGLYGCKIIIKAMVQDKEFMNEKVFPQLEKELSKTYGEDKIHRINAILLENKTKDYYSSKEDAERVLNLMSAVLDKFKRVTVEDYYDIIGKTTSYSDSLYGWTDLTGSRVKQIGIGWIVEFPEPVKLQKEENVCED